MESDGFQTSGIDSTRVYPQSGGNASHVNLPATTVINVNSIGFYNAAYPGGSAITSVVTRYHGVYPGGGERPFRQLRYLSRPPTITIKDSSNTAIVTAAAMTLVATGTESPSLTKIYEYAYTVPASPTASGRSKSQLTEGTEGTVTDTAYATMPVVSSRRY